MDRRIQRIDETLASVVSLSKKVHLFFAVLFFAYCAVAIAYLSLYVLSLKQPASAFSLLSPMELLELLPMLLSLMIGGTCIYVMRCIFKDIAHGQSPFSVKHSRRIGLVAWLFVADAIVGTIFSPNFFSAFVAGDACVGYVASDVPGFSVVPIDIRGIAGAVLCFALSIIWRYGVLLQRDEDDLV